MTIKTAWDSSLDYLLKAKEDFKYQEDLTNILDKVREDFDENLLNKIALWKVNRYFKLNEELIEKLNALKDTKPGNYKECQDVLEQLLDKKLRGIDLPMASTILRFRNPKAFQIIDKRAYRVVMGEKLNINVATTITNKIQIYFRYLEKLWEFSKEKKIPFEDLDRVLYQFDKEQNKDMDLNGKKRAKKRKIQN
jgi:thermostable 8-oxoguanine DNA glycosylase